MKQLPKNFSEITNKVIAKISAMDRQQRYLVFGGVLLFVFLLDYLILMRPQLGALGKLSPKIQTLAADLKTNKDNIQKIDYYRSESERLKEKVALLNARVRSKEEMSQVLEEISSLANDNRVKIDQIIPNMDDTQSILKNNHRNYSTLPIAIEAKSNFHNLGRFINKLETAEIFFTVGNLMITPGDDTRQHSIKLTVNAIVYEPAKNEKK